MKKLQINEDWIYQINTRSEWIIASKELIPKHKDLNKEYSEILGKYHGPGIYVVTSFIYTKNRHGVAIEVMNTDKIDKLLDILN